MNDPYLEPARERPVFGDYDVVVAGGGPAGIGAALAAARAGAKTLLLEQHNALGGVAGPGGHGFMCLCNDWGGRQRVVGGIAWELLERVEREGIGDLWPGKAFFDVEAYKFMLERMMADAGVDLLYHTFACEPVVADGAVVGVVTQGKDGRRVVRAKRVVDATGDADLAAAAGCPHRQGRDRDGACQPMTLMFTLGGVDIDRVRENMRTPDGGFDYQMKHVWAVAQKNGDMEPFQKTMMGLWWNSRQPTYVGVNFTHVVGLDATRAADLTRATVETRRQAYQCVDVFRNYLRGMEQCHIVATGATVGIRETRRIDAEYVLTEDDLRANRPFDDTIAYGAFFIDIHGIDAGGMDGETWQPPPGFRYRIPYRCLVPRGVDNLLVAGRCAGFTHVALGSARVMSQCTAMGEAAGLASAMSIEAGVAPRALPVASLREALRVRDGVVDDADIRPIPTTGAEQRFQHLPYQWRS